MDATSNDGRRAGQRLRFAAALVIFGLWVAGLAGMAATSGRPPQAAKPAPAASP